MRKKKCKSNVALITIYNFKNHRGECGLVVLGDVQDALSVTHQKKKKRCTKCEVQGSSSNIDSLGLPLSVA